MLTRTLAAKALTFAAALMLTGVALSPVAAAASAPSPEEIEMSVTVEYHDLDLTTQAGQTQLERRIERAARRVCELDVRDPGTRVLNRAARECYDSVMTRYEARLATIIQEHQRGG